MLHRLTYKNLITISLVFFSLITSRTLSAQTAEACFAAGGDPACCASPDMTLSAQVSYTGNVFTTTLTASLPGACSNYTAAYFSFGNGGAMSASVVPSAYNEFTVTHTYVFPNVCQSVVYTVSACVMLESGSSCVKTATVEFDHPSESFYITATSALCNQYNFSFSGGSQLVNGMWVFGNGYSQPVSNGSSGTISYTYPAAGTYTAYLTGEGIAPCIFSVETTVSDFPGSDFTYTVNNDCNTASGIDLSISAYAPGLYTYQWIVNGTNAGSPGMQMISHSAHLVPGTNTITLSVSDGTCTVPVTKTVNIGNTGSYAIQVLNTACKTVTLQYTGPTMQQAQWSFGDGIVSPPVTSSSHTIVHTYPGAGHYVVSLSGSGLGSCDIQQAVTVSDGLKAGFTHTVVDPCTSGSGIILAITNYVASNTYAWEINQNTIFSQGATATYFTNLVNGVNVIKLIVTNGSGCSASVSKVVNIGSPPASFNITSPACLGDHLSVFDVAPGGDNYQWSIGSGSPALQNGMNPDYTYTVTGSVPVTLTITTSYPGHPTPCQHTFASTVNVFRAPDASFSLSPVSCNKSVTLALSTPTTVFTSYSISYGDGTSYHANSGTIPSAQLSHTYLSTQSQEVFPVHLLLYNGPCASELEQTVTVYNTTSLVVIAPAPYICPGAPALVHATIIGPYPGASYSYQWTGPDGFNAMTPSISVEKGGNYSLVVTGSAPCPVSFTGTQSLTLLAAPMVTLAGSTDMDCFSGTGSATVTVSEALQKQGFILHGTTVTANPSASGTETYSIPGLVEGNNYITVSNLLYPSCSGNIAVSIRKDKPDLSVSVTHPQNCSPGYGTATVSTSNAGTLTWYEQSAPASLITTTTGLSASNLLAGSYVVTNIYGNCISKELFSVENPVISVSRLSGAGACAGATTPVTLTAAFMPSSVSGSFSYTLYALPSGTVVSPVSGQIFDLYAGTYSVNVQSKGCQASSSFKVKTLDPVEITFRTRQPGCKRDGEVTALVSGGDGDYQYAWYWNGSLHSGTTSVLSLSGLSSAASISLSVTDASGCKGEYPSSPLLVSPATTVSLVNCSGVGNGQATHISGCEISACVQDGTPPYRYEWLKKEVARKPVLWQFRYDENGVFVAFTGSHEIPVPIPVLNPVPLGDNSDFSINSVMYPYWNTTVSPYEPIMNPAGQTFTTGNSPFHQHYYTVTELVDIDEEPLISMYSGPSAQPGSTEPFTTGDYNLRVTDAEGCSYTFSIGTLTFADPSSFSINFSYVWGMNRIPQPVEEVDPNLHENMIEAANEMLDQAGKCMAQQVKVLKSDLKVNCADLSNFRDGLNVSYELREGHYTLYYYDRAGRLTRTVPPQGVHCLDSYQVGQIRQNRTGASNPWPVQTHRLATTYEYNSFGQLVSQNTPDGGATVFIYDSQNRLRFSQNDRQKPGNSYSYTKYDALGRIVEVGESQGNGPDFTNLQAPPNLALADNSLAPQPGGSVLNRQVTRTIYSIPSPVTCYGMPQRFTQNRVSYTLIDDDPLTAGDEHYTYFSYDSHGNVEWIVQDDPGGIGQNNIRYDYDLVSGKVLRVSYNENRADRFFHRYVYDADNRLTATETSRDGEIWDRDAFYAYYPHGPLKRTELGEDHVQGLDYIYTIQGWLKALNSPALVNGDDPGQDNSSTGPALGRTAEDRFGMVLNYYNGDYSTNTLNFLTANSNYSLAAYSGSNGAAPSLYNGNISGWIQSQLDNTASGPEAPRADLFRYDILNRIRQSTSVKEDPLLGWSAIHTADSYSTGYTYDANGNILSLTRADELGDAMDEFSYTYDHGAGLSNRLTGLSDAVTVTQSGRADLQGTHTYSYDPTGNLVEETGEELLDYGSGAALYNFTTTISWNVYGKIREVNKTILRGADPLREKLRFRYDAAGNRVRKEFWKDDVTVHDGIEDPEEVTTTFYVRDAQGNTMATYRRSYDVTDQLFKLHLTEQPIYGSERLGMNTKPLLLASAASVGGLGTPVNGPQSISEYQNWITTSSKTQLLPAGASVNNDNLCQCRVIAMNLNQPGSQYQYAQNALEFLGIAHNGIALAEDLSGDLQFFVVQAKAYLGAKDACLVFDRSGKLMQGNEKIGPVAVNSKPVIVNLPGTNRYNIVTLDAQRHPVYHVVDMNSQGYGPVGNMGEVLSGNNPLDPSITNTALTHGYHFTGVEDHVTGNSIVYSSRYTPDPLHPGQGTTDLLAYDFGSGTLTPQSHLLYSQNGCGDSGQGQLQISPDGGKLGWWQYTEQMAGFSHRQADIYTLPLNSSRTGLSAAPSQFSISAAGSYGNGLLEFMKNSDNLLYSQRGLYQENSGSVKYDKNIWNYDPLNLSSVSINPDSPTLSYLFGEIKRGKDGNYYIPHMGQAADKLHSYSGSAFGSDVSLPDKTYELASSWPTQVYKIFNQGSTVQEYKRRVGEKSYELKDHLGNVRVVISDAKQIIDTDADNTVSSADSFEPEVLSYNDYYAFGMLMPGRQFNSGNYRYGFNGQEKDDEIAGIGNIMTAEYWEYDARIGRRWNMDPKPTIGISDYACFANNPIWNTDPFGDKVRNGYEKDLANAKERVADKQKKFNDAKGLNKFFKGVGLAFSKANLNVVQSRYDETDALIEKYKQANPEDYEKIDNLQNEKNEEVDVFVRVEPNLKVNDRSINKPEGINLDGLTSMYYETEPDTKDNAPKVIPYSQHYGRNTVLVRVNSSAGNKKKTLGHEFGHTFFNVVSSTWMQTWILLHPNAPAGGHGKDAASGEPNPSGVAAEEWEKRTK